MKKKTLKDLSKKMKDLDYCMMSTVTGRGEVSSRPMSNNREVDYDGDSYFFTYGDTRMVKDVELNPYVNLSFEGKKALFISIEGKAILIRDRGEMKERWSKGLKQWFKKGVDTPGIVMIRVKAKRIKYWQKEKEGEVTVK